MHLGSLPHLRYLRPLSIRHRSGYVCNSLVTGSRSFHNDDEGHRICMVITLILVEDSAAQRDPVNMEIIPLHVTLRRRIDSVPCKTRGTSTPSHSAQLRIHSYRLTPEIAITWPINCNDMQNLSKPIITFVHGAIHTWKDCSSFMEKTIGCIHLWVYLWSLLCDITLKPDSMVI